MSLPALQHADEPREAPGGSGLRFTARPAPLHWQAVRAPRSARSETLGTLQHLSVLQRTRGGEPWTAHNAEGETRGTHVHHPRPARRLRWRWDALGPARPRRLLRTRSKPWRQTWPDGMRSKTPRATPPYSSVSAPPAITSPRQTSRPPSNNMAFPAYGDCDGGR